MPIPAKLPKKKKIYCVNCGNYIYSIYYDNDLCVSSSNVQLEYKDSYERKSVQTTYLKSPRVKNRLNNCVDYKRSLFWGVLNFCFGLLRRGGGWDG